MERETDLDNSLNPLLRVIAVFEEDFSIDWLEELTGMKASSILSVLEGQAQEKVLARRTPGTYVTVDAQKRKEWLDRIGPDDLERYHRSIAQILIRELPDDDSKAFKVSHHLLQVSNDWDGCRWLMRAGEAYGRLFKNGKASECFAKILNDLSDRRGDDEDWLFIRGAVEYSNNIARRTSPTETLSLLQDARERARRLHAQSYEILIEMHIAKFEWIHFERDSALKRFERTLSRVNDLGDPELMAATTTFNTYFLFWQGRFKEVIENYEKSVPDVERYPVGLFPIIASVMVGHCYSLVGQVTQGLGMLDAVRNYCLQGEDLFLAAYAGCGLAMVMLLIGQVEDSIKYLRSVLKEAKSTSNYAIYPMATLTMAYAHYLRGDNKRSLSYVRTFLQDSDGSGRVNVLLYPYLLEILWAAERGDFPHIPDLSLEQIIDQMFSINNLFAKGVAFRYQAVLGKWKGWPNDKVVQALSLSAKWLEKSGNRIAYAETRLELARHYLSAGSNKKSRRELHEAAEILTPVNPKLIPDELRVLAGNQNLQGIILEEIMKMAKDLVTAHDDKRPLQMIVAAVNRITGAERGALLLLDGETDPPTFRLRASKNITIEEADDPNFIPSRKLIHEVLTSGEGRIFEMDPVQDGDARPREMVRSSICVPVTLDKKIIGLLYHENRLLAKAFKKSDLDLLSYFAALATLDLDLERSRHEIERLRQKDREKDTLHEGRDIEVPHFDGIIGTSPEMQNLLAQVSQIAETDTSVLILGETGVGKNLLAAAIHRQSLRRDGPFITVQCSALTESLITSELFGHEKGAFTGATNRRIGRFELADKGTLFLDEIGDLSLEVQSRLLRVLQTKEFERVGGGKEILTSDFRLIAATNRDLEKEIEAKRFREDLYYRINVVPLHMPALKDRKEDIPLLAYHFFKIFTAKYKRSFDRIPEQVMDRLIRYDWPGNIRELENVIQRGVVGSRGSHFTIPPFKKVRPEKSGQDTFPTLEDNERHHIIEALKMTTWKIHGPGGAAQILAINPSTLASRMKKLGIMRPSTGTVRE